MNGNGRYGYPDMIAPQRALSVLVPSPDLASGLPQLGCLRMVSDPAADLADLTTYLFVVVSLLELPDVADFVREATRRHYLRGLFVRDDGDSHLLPQILQKANLRTVRSMVVHSDPDVPARVLRAFSIGAEDELIGNATVIEGLLFLIGCSGATYDIPMDQHPVLRRIPKPDRHRFCIAPDGAFVHWPKQDIHLDLGEARIFLDPGEQEKAKARSAQSSEQFGQALVAIRNRQKIRQSDIPGLSERQVRRYEHGARVPLQSLRTLAKAHGMQLNDYLDELAVEAF